jgi:hypothetical protein
MIPRDRYIFLTLMDSAIMAAWGSHVNDQEAIALFSHCQELNKLIAEQTEKGARVYVETLRIKQDQILERHSMALHRSSEYKGQYAAYQAIRKYMGRMGYKFV